MISDNKQIVALPKLVISTKFKPSLKLQNTISEDLKIQSLTNATLDESPTRAKQKYNLVRNIIKLNCKHFHNARIRNRIYII